jgi:hypothetical protein
MSEAFYQNQLCRDLQVMRSSRPLLSHQKMLGVDLLVLERLGGRQLERYRQKM